MARRRVVSGAKRLTKWVGQADQDAIAVASGASVIIASFDAGAAHMIRPTVVRTRGEVSIINSVFTGGNVVIGGAFGVCVVTQEALAAGTASIPRPFDDSDWDGWYVWQSFRAEYELADATGKVGLNAGSLRYQVDSKGMRKLTENERLVMMAESQTGAFDIAMHLRMLMLLS